MRSGGLKVHCLTAARAAAAGAPVAAGPAFEVLPGAGADHFRLPFYLPPDQMRLGVKILAEEIDLAWRENGQ